MIRMSVTEIDGYRWWKSQEDSPLDVLLARLRRQEEPTQAMMAGRAFHKVLENANIGELYSVEMDGFRFRFELDGEMALPPIRELKGEIVIPTSVGDVTLVGVVDGMNGRRVRDYKLTERFDAEKYADSYQWRSYLPMFGCNQFTYDVFVAKVDSDDGEYIVHDYQPLTFYAYDGMANDVKLEVEALAQVIARYVPERIVS